MEDKKDDIANNLPRDPRKGGIHSNEKGPKMTWKYAMMNNLTVYETLGP